MPHWRRRKNLRSLRRPLPWTRSRSRLLSSCSARGATTCELRLCTVRQEWLHTRTPRNRPFFTTHLSSSVAASLRAGAAESPPSSSAVCGGGGGGGGGTREGSSMGWCSCSHSASLSHLGSESHSGPGSDRVDEISSLSFAAAQEDLPSLLDGGGGAAMVAAVPRDLDLVRGQLGVAERDTTCGSGSGVTLLLPSDSRLIFGSSPRT